jgi:hypothetical protein
LQPKREPEPLACRPQQVQPAGIVDNEPGDALRSDGSDCRGSAHRVQERDPCRVDVQREQNAQVHRVRDVELVDQRLQFAQYSRVGVRLRHIGNAPGKMLAELRNASLNPRWREQVAG